MLFVAALFPAALFNSAPGLQERPYSVQEYRCEITANYVYLREISDEFGNILLSEDYESIFPASIEVVGSFDELKRGLESMDVPEEMRPAYDALLKSVDSYRQSADLIRIAVGTALGEYEPTGADPQELMDRSVGYVTMANQYLGESLALHGSIFQAQVQDSDECQTHFAGNY